MDKPFSPLGPTIQVGTSAVQVPLPLAGNCYRVRCLVTAYLTWSATNAAVTSVGAPTGATQATWSANTIGLTAGAVEKLSNIGPFFIASAAAAFEVTAGDGL